MAWNTVDIPHKETALRRSLDLFNADPLLKRYFHNEFVGRLQKRQQALESIDADNLKAVQEVIKELKQLLEFLHRDTSQNEKKFYEQRSNSG